MRSLCYPNGDIKTLPSGATVIDFAYAIHSAVGNRMTGAKVNGKIVPITYKLKTGEICEVLTSNQPGKGPSRDWLKVVTTGEARSKIRSWFKKERRDENIVQGKAEVDRELRRNFIRLDGEQYDAFCSGSPSASTALPWRISTPPWAMAGWSSAV